MPRLLATTALIGALFAAPALAQTMNDAAPAPAQGQTQAQAQAKALAQQDRSFADDAATGGKAEIDMGRLAEQKGGTQAIKDFGRQMVDDHSKAGDQLDGIAKKQSLNLPTALDQKDQALRGKLANESGNRFDRDYVKAAVDTHKDAVSQFEKESRSGQNPDLKQFATQTLPILKHHLQMAQALQADMNRGTPQATNQTDSSGSSTRPATHARGGDRATDNNADQLNRQELQSLNK